MNITETVRYIGVNDMKIKFFEGQFPVDNGMAYNSYLFLDEKIAILDTVDAEFGDCWIKAIEREIGDRQPDYLIVQHMEPDHSSNIQKFVEKFPQATVVSNKKAFDMMFCFFRELDLTGKMLVVGEGDTLNLGSHELTFALAPMVHWPEVMVTYDKKDKILFSADGFGKFGAIGTEEDWASEARRYYYGIVGKFGAQVQSLLKKLSAFEVEKICPLHGPVLTENLAYYLNLYDIWSSYKAEDKGVFIAYTSVYGNTKKAVDLLAEKLSAKGCENVVVCDLANTHVSYAIANAYKFDKIVLATTTYNGEVFPPMKQFLGSLTDRNFQNRTLALIENGAWAPNVIKYITKTLENSKNLNFLDTNVRIKASVSHENIIEIENMAEALCAK